ncbi:MAG: ABC transporter substrate-binding protein, partial [Alphaproteobacteria bacterium]
RYGITVQHVKNTDTAYVVSRVVAEKAGGRLSGGSVDLVWINGENFKAMKSRDLLFGPFVDRLPHFGLIDPDEKPTTVIDFTEPVDGLEAPWGMAKVVFMYDTARLTAPPRSIAAMLAWAAANPGRLAYPQPPDFTGTTFLKQALHELVADPTVLQSPPTDETFATVTQPLWQWLAAITPHLWRGGRAFPANEAALRQLLDDGEIDIAITFNPGSASSAIAQGLLPDTVRTYVLDGGTIANTHFVAIPFNASAPEAAMVVADFLLSPEAQARKQDPRLWGDPTVLSMARLSDAERALFDALPLGIATLSPADLGRALPEPHPEWMTRIESEWRRRHSQ